MTAVVTSPSGHTEQCMISEVGHSNYSIRFVPQEMGVHTVSVRHRNMHIPGKFPPSPQHLNGTRKSADLLSINQLIN